MTNEQKILQKMKEDLAVAVKEKDYAKIEEISRILDISEEQKKYFAKGLTGYPSIDKPWLKYYDKDAEEKTASIAKGRTIWDVVEEKLLEHYDIPALEYFGRVFSRQEFIDLCYTWAKTFRAMGVNENEIVPIYGPFVPDICAMYYALNMIGACPYFLKLAIGPKDLAEETKEAKIAVVLDSMWPNVGYEFSKDKFQNVIVATATADMPSPKKEIVSFMSKMKSLKNKSKIPDEKKYIWADKAREIANYYSGDVKVPFMEGRRAIITSSSGTTGGVKGTIATNESVLTQTFSTTYSDILYQPGFRTLNHFPPTAATSDNALFTVGLVNGATIIIDPRVSAKDFYNQLIYLKPNICINTGSLWKTFFNRLSTEVKNGKKFDLNYAKGWMIGGEGTFSRILKEWDQLMKELGGGRIIPGYGLSEIFSGLSYDRVDVEPNYSKPIISSGLIQAGMIASIHDKEGNELPYNQRGELRIRTKAAMQGYYGKPELTSRTIVDGQVITGDLAEIDENGFIFIWGRLIDKIILPTGEEQYLIDIVSKIMENKFFDDAIILSMPTNYNDNNLVAHIVWNKNVAEKDKKEYLNMVNEQLKNYLPKEITVSAYAEHHEMLPYSETTLKKDTKNKMSKQTTGYIQVIDGEINQVKFVPGDNGKYIQENNIVKKEKTKRILRK